jgi:hypothetical protein
MPGTWTLEHLTPGKIYYLPPDIYFIGDVFNAIDMDNYDNSLGESGYSDGLYKFNNSIMLVSSTILSDCSYIGSDNHTYVVESGVIGITSSALITKNTSAGKFYNFPDGVYVNMDYGRFRFKTKTFDLCIDTQIEEDEEEDPLSNILSKMEIE